nr:MAG TPA: hypothetical protein [Caudoviricetes sp.]
MRGMRLWGYLNCQINVVNVQSKMNVIIRKWKHWLI